MIIMRRRATFGIIGALVVGASLYAGHKDDVDRSLASTGTYKAASRLADDISHELYRFRHRDIYKNVEAELDRKMKGDIVFLEIGAPWCEPCHRLNAYLFGDNGIAQKYPCIKFESIELDEGVDDDVRTPRNKIIKNVLIERGMSGDPLYLPTTFVIKDGTVESCMIGFELNSKTTDCDSKQKVNIEEKLKKCK